MTYRETLKRQIAILEAAAAKLTQEMKTSSQRSLDCPDKSRRTTSVLLPELQASVDIVAD